MASSNVSSVLVERSPVYYGWVVLSISTLGMAATLPGQTAGISLFIDAFIEDLGLSRSVVSWLYTAATVIGSLALPLAGRLLDRYGPRRVAVALIALLAISCVGMRWVSGWVGVFVGFMCLRGFGQGALSLVNNHAVNLWFERRRGLAVGVLGVGMAGATALFPPLMEMGLQAYGWQTTYLIMGGLLAVIMLPLGALLYRDAPERYGLSPDPPVASPNQEMASGAAPSKTTGAEDAAIRGVRPAVAYRTWTFWLFTGAGVCTAGFGTGLLFHHFSILEEVGVARGRAAQFFVPLGVVTGLLNVGTGWLVDRYPPRLLLAGQLTLFGAMMALLPAVDTTAEVWAYGGVFGVAQGMQGALLGSAYAYYFGRAHHGTIRGLANTVFIGGTAIGPAVLALGPDFLGGFAPILWIVTPIPLVLALAALLGWAMDWDAGVLERGEEG
ncbi:MFS transporter [Salinibacter altiplanensis]|uniref:MFS transporter n=1 Tax=Salinibacter altiplanensis TaxID=1803181 RepID=UPI000C9EED3A|nr:MFS transporter [Salinibacter altiplanensis]